MGASDSFTGFVYQVFIISPAISWILQPGRFSKQRGFVYAVSFLVALAAISIVSALAFVLTTPSKLHDALRNG
jgi:hypothetical protein